MAQSFSPRTVHFSDFGEEECNESQIRFLKLKMKRRESDTENKKKHTKKVLENVNTIYERFEKYFGVEG